MGKAIRVSALILLLACTAQAGWMGNGSPEPMRAGWMPSDSPTPPAQAGLMPSESPASAEAGGGVYTASADGLTQLALELLAVLPSLP
jgi:hypothetical protein